ncbi:MAG TPA: hypothetical protein VGV40_01755 [Solirubrobacteraceae bacterium]|nr:hypothetical protein [Solirubrobacteraceae bacterium]
MRRLLPLVAVMLAGLSACGEDDQQRPSRSFTAELRPLNDSGVEGTVELVSRRRDRLQVDIDATGLTPNQIHQQQIHGFTDDGRDAECPDEEGGGLLLSDEARESYGRVVKDLAPYPTVGEEGKLNWDMPVEVNADRLRPLSDRVVVLYGKKADRESVDAGTIYEPELPVACGVIKRRRASD